MKLKPVNDQVVVIMGASKGIGRATAKRFAKRGAKVLVAARSQKGIESLVEEISRDDPSTDTTKRSKNVIGMVCDVSSTDQIASVAQKAVDEWGRIDTWVQVAAIVVLGNVEDTTEEEFSKLMDVNYMGQIRAVKVALPYLKLKGGALILLSSVLSKMSYPGMAAYCATKHAVQSLADCLRIELRQQNSPVSVTSILPSAIDTPVYNHCRNKVNGGKYVYTLPFAYPPEMVADSIIFASEHPRKEIVVGDYGYLGLWVVMLLPWLVELFLVYLGKALATRSATKDPVDNIDTVIDSDLYNTERGHWGAIVIPFSVYNTYIERGIKGLFLLPFLVTFSLICKIFK